MVGVAQLVEPRIVIPVVVGSSPIVHPIFLICGRGEIGRHARFRFWCRKVWEFESLRPHHLVSKCSWCCENYCVGWLFGNKSFLLPSAVFPFLIFLLLSLPKLNLFSSICDSSLTNAAKWLKISRFEKTAWAIFLALCWSEPVQLQIIKLRHVSRYQAA